MAINGTLTKIETINIGAGGSAAFTFTAIPATYDDIYIVLSGRSDRSNIEDFLKVAFNSDTSDGNYSGILMYGQGSGSAGAETFTSAGVPRYAGNTVGATATASIFSNVGIYIAGYRSSRNKTYSVDMVTENNATASRIQMATGVWANNSAITSVSLATAFGTLVQYSSATIYGVSNVASTAKATGGILYEDSTYLYHLFTGSNIFTPLQALTADVLVLGGGGGAANGPGGGAGAGQVLLYSNQSLTATNYVITVGGGGAGGAAGTGGNAGANGGTSQFGSTTAALAGSGAPNENGGASGNGNAGGTSSVSTYYASAGGGGLGAVGANGNGTTGIAGEGGAGVNTYSSWLYATSTGINGFIGGGGGGGAAAWSNTSYQPNYGSIGGVGGGGGGGRTGYNDPNQMPGANGTTNTGSGGGGGGYYFQAGVANHRGKGGNGGSGLVIVRYTK